MFHYDYKPTDPRSTIDFKHRNKNKYGKEKTLKAARRKINHITYRAANLRIAEFLSENHANQKRDKNLEAVRGKKST